MRGRMSGMDERWIPICLLAVLISIVWVAGIHGLITGEATVKGRCHKRSEEPLGYWFIVGARFVFALFWTGVLIWMLSDAFRSYGN